MRLLGLGGFGAEAAHEVFHVRDLFLLALESLVLLHDALCAGALEVIVVAGVGVDGAIMHMGDAIDAGVEELAVVRHQQDAAGVTRQILFQPQDGFEVEVVGGFVEQQQVGAVHQRARQIEPHAPAAGETGDGALQAIVGKPQAIEQLRRPCGSAVTVDGFVAMLRIEPCRIVVLFGECLFQYA